MTAAFVTELALPRQAVPLRSIGYIELERIYNSHADSETP